MSFSIEPLSIFNQHSRFTVFKRLIHLSVFSGALIVVILLLSLFSEYRSQWYRLHSAQPGEILSVQYAKIIQPQVQLNNHQATLDILMTLTQLPHVISACVYDEKGIEWVVSGQLTDVTQMPLKARSPITYMQTIYAKDGKIIGYFQLLLDRELTLAQPITLHGQLFFIGIWLVLLSALISIYITRGIYKAKPLVTQWLQRTTTPEQ